MILFPCAFTPIVRRSWQAYYVSLRVPVATVQCANEQGTPEADGGTVVCAFPSVLAVHVVHKYFAWTAYQPMISAKRAGGVIQSA